MFVMGSAANGHATPKAIKIWAYGDGETTRMLSELVPMLPASGPGLTVKNRSVPSSGPTAWPGNPSVTTRLQTDLGNYVALGG